MLAAVRQAPDRLAAVVETDEAFVLMVAKGRASWTASSGRRGGKAGKPGLSREQAADPGHVIDQLHGRAIGRARELRPGIRCHLVAGKVGDNPVSFKGCKIESLCDILRLHRGSPLF